MSGASNRSGAADRRSVPRGHHGRMPSNWKNSIVAGFKQQRQAERVAARSCGALRSRQRARPEQLPAAMVDVSVAGSFRDVRRGFFAQLCESRSSASSGCPDAARGLPAVTVPCSHRLERRFSFGCLRMRCRKSGPTSRARVCWSAHNAAVVGRRGQQRRSRRRNRLAPAPAALRSYSASAKPEMMKYIRCLPLPPGRAAMSRTRPRAQRRS